MKKKVKAIKEETPSSFKVTFEYLSRLDDEIQFLRKEMKSRSALATIFEKRMKNLEKDLATCEKALALG